MKILRRLRAWGGKKIEVLLWHFLQGRVRRAAQEKAEAAAEHMRKDLELQMNFQPKLPAGWRERVKTGDNYVGFENLFRDSATIAERNKRYLKFFQNKSPVLDVGCGRGEFLELLKQHHVAAQGIDSSPDMIQACRSRGLENVERADANSHLSSLPKESLGGIFSCHVVEHMAVEGVIQFFPLAYAALQAEGILVVETPNPHSLPAFKLFWLDPTHVRPLFPEFLEWAARAGGFTEVDIMYLTEDGFSPTHSPWHGNYALIAKKR